MKQGDWVKVIIPDHTKASKELRKIEGHLGKTEEAKRHPEMSWLVKLHNLDGLIPIECLKVVRHIEYEDWNKEKTECKALVKK